MSARDEPPPIDVTPADVTPADVTPADCGDAGADAAGEDVLGGPRPAPAWLRRLLVGSSRQRRVAAVVGSLAAAAIVAGTLARTAAGTHHPPRQAAIAPNPAAASTATAPSPDTYVLTLSDIVGDRCPAGVSCGVSAQVSPAMTAALLADFGPATLGLRARAFDPNSLTVYWQQVTASVADGVVVVTQQRTAESREQQVEVTGDARMGIVTVAARRGHWVLTVELIGARRPPLASAERWARTVALPD